ncbi:MAG: prolipoprotein diacylglyceryl transferase family protein [Planctomycetota bacterium]
MHPILFNFFGFPVSSFGMMVALGLLLGLIWTHLLARSHGVDVRVIERLFPAILLGGVLGARLLFVGLNWAAFSNQPWRALYVWEGGLVLLGGLFGASVLGLVVLLRMRQPLGRLADILTPGAFLALAVGRIGSLLVGDDFGRPTDAAWAIRFPDLDGSLLPYPLLDVPLHPTQLYHAAAALCIFVLTSLLLKWRRLVAGQVFCVSLLLYAGARFYLENYRGDDEARGFFGPYSTSQCLCACLVPAAMLLLIVCFARRRKQEAA